MDRSELTAKQRQALQCVEGARAAGMALSDYAASRRLPVRQVYDALVPLRKKGFLPRSAGSAQSPFVAVRVLSTSTQTPTPSTGGPRVVCRIAQGGGPVIECAEWPPPAWLAALLGAKLDAAP